MWGIVGKQGEKVRKKKGREWGIVGKHGGKNWEASMQNRYNY